MTALRWLVGVSCALALAMFLLIMIVGNGIRSMYQSGASTADTLRNLLIFAIPVLIAAMFVSVFTPNSRGFLHVTAIGAGAAMMGCLWIALKSPGEGALYLCFFGLWMAYYASAIFNRA